MGVRFLCVGLRADNVGLGKKLNGFACGGCVGRYYTLLDFIFLNRERHTAGAMGVRAISPPAAPADVNRFPIPESCRRIRDKWFGGKVKPTGERQRCLVNMWVCWSEPELSRWAMIDRPERSQDVISEV